jgi:1,4-dihydroxy-6-naphthoate synthase
MKLTFGFSPCPNDTFIFDALVNGAIDTEGISFEPVLEDVQTLNQWAGEGRLDITKLSFPALFANKDAYALMRSGAALGKGVGPLLVAKTLVNVPDMDHCTVAIPGEGTTANFLLRSAFPQLKNKVPMLFSEIEEAVLAGRTDLGVLIHENRFTYQQKGLVKVADLGTLWEEKTGAAIPLGCIAMKRSFDEPVRKKVERLIRSSLVHAFHDYPKISAYVQQHAQAMDETVMRQHIELYVNDFTADLGEVGEGAIETLYGVYNEGSSAEIKELF